MTNVELVKQGYSDFTTGNLEAVLAMWTPKLNGTNARVCLL